MANVHRHRYGPVEFLRLIAAMSPTLSYVCYADCKTTKQEIYAHANDYNRPGCTVVICAAPLHTRRSSPLIFCHSESHRSFCCGVEAAWAATGQHARSQVGNSSP
jgi:hypothetical protein